MEEATEGMEVDLFCVLRGAFRGIRSHSKIQKILSNMVGFLRIPGFEEFEEESLCRHLKTSRCSHIININ
jgi:hypothetical protein